MQEPEASASRRRNARAYCGQEHSPDALPHFGNPNDAPTASSKTPEHGIDGAESDGERWRSKAGPACIGNDETRVATARRPQKIERHGLTPGDAANSNPSRYWKNGRRD
jgi:hypothetical protein